jgi:hypothetical protein
VSAKLCEVRKDGGKVNSVGEYMWGTKQWRSDCGCVIVGGVSVERVIMGHERRRRIVCG